MMSGSPSPSQSATLRHVYPHFASAGPWMEPLCPAMMRIGSAVSIPPRDAKSRVSSNGAQLSNFASAHFGSATPGPLRFSKKQMYPVELPQMRS